MKLEKLATAALLTIMALPLTGCPVYPHTGVPYTPGPYPYKPPVADSLNGPSLGDAYHDVEKWLASHYPGASLVAVDGPAVGRSGRSGGKGWTFKYAVAAQVDPQPQPWPTPMPKPTPSQPPKWTLQPGEQYGPPAEDAALVGNRSAGIVSNNNPYLRYDEPAREGKQWVAPPRTRYMAITVDGSGRLLAPEDVPGPTEVAAVPASFVGAPASKDLYQDDRVSILPFPMPQPAPQALDFNRTVSITKLLATIEDFGNRISPAGVRVAIGTEAGGRAVVDIDPQVADRGYGPTDYPTYGPYGPEPSGGPYAASENRKPGYGVQCVAPPDRPWPYETGSSGVLYRGTYLFNAYTGELLSRPARI